MPVEDSHTRKKGLVPFMINITHFRIKPLALTSGHGRYNITVTPKQTFFSVGEWPLHIAVTNRWDL
jgi:hypothetical protein